MNERIATQVTSTHNVFVLAGLLGIGLTGSIATHTPNSDALAQRSSAGIVESVAQQVAQHAMPAAIQVAPAAHAAKVVQGALAPRPAQTFQFEDTENAAYDHVRKQVRWLPVKYAGSVLKTPDPQSRLLLAQSAAQHAGLSDVGLSYRDVYGIINAETSWVPRLGSSKNGTPNLGIAQFEPATAKAVGLRNPNDPVESVHAAAVHLKDAAKWSAKRIAGLKLTPEEHAAKLREGVSIYYNLSVKGRNKWNGLNTAKLPVETQRHIANARLGAREAAELESQLRAVKGRMGGEGLMTASLR